MLSLETIETKALARNLDDLGVNLRHAHADGREMVHEPLGHREPTAANDRHAAQARQLGDDASLFALVGDGKFAPKLVRGIGDALEGPIYI